MNYVQEEPRKHKDNKNNLRFTVTKNQKQFKHAVARTCTLTEWTGCDSRSGTAPHADQKCLYYKNFCRKSTSATAAWSDAVASEE